MTLMAHPSHKTAWKHTRCEMSCLHAFSSFFVLARASSLSHTFLDSDDDGPYDDAEVVNIQNKHWQMKEAETGRQASEIEGISISDRMKMVRSRHAEIMAAGLMLKVASCSLPFQPYPPSLAMEGKGSDETSTQVPIFNNVRRSMYFFVSLPTVHFIPRQSLHSMAEDFGSIDLGDQDDDLLG
jgi:hypothetical protein